MQDLAHKLNSILKPTSEAIATSFYQITFQTAIYTL